MRGEKVLSRVKQNPVPLLRVHCQKNICPVMMMKLKVKLGNGCQGLQCTGALHSHVSSTSMLLEYEGIKLLTEDD